ncbi:type II secretion system protein E [Geobacter sp. OR-1]|uniref:ATPase, T2SS/T4P/T4SS family n=1 Tax=Geobacter sp. OR-1 TaxID=1266765 RepID=UPI000542DDC5|nr:pilus assembly protein PilB [Geobacter sp. OR-1]GAM11268.1 type II secretion system protein E [Geobacter sp. OR-1]
MEGVIREGSLGNILLKSNIITEEDIKAALREQQALSCRFGEALVSLGIVAQEDIDWALSNQLDIPYVRLKKNMIDPAAVELLPSVLAREYNLIPLIRAGDELNVAMADPLNRAAIEAVEKATGCQVRVSVGLIREIREMLDHFFGPPVEPVSFGFTSTAFSPRVVEIVNADATGAKFLDYVLAYFIQSRLSVLSLQPLGDSVALLARRGGVSRNIGQLVVTHYQEFLLNLRKWCHSGNQTASNIRGIFNFNFRGQGHAFQVHMLRGLGGDLVTFKLHISASFPARFADLQLTGEREAQLRRVASGSGLVIVVHRDSDERCRLMDLLLAETDTSGKSVILIGEELGNGSRGFPRIPCRGGFHSECHGLITAALEHDPDILVIEDATEPESFIAASKAAMRGKLVLAGLDFKDMGSTLRHLLHFWQKHYVIPTYIRGIVSCRRVALLCPNCRKPMELSEDESAALGTHLPPGSYYKAVGCPECDLTGYRGSRYLLDLIPFDKGVVDAFEAAADGREIIGHLDTLGHRGSGEDGADLLKSGDISPEEYVTSILL